MMCGGVGEAKEADAEIQALCDQVRSDAEAKAGVNGKYPEFVAVKYSTQVVAGTNYFIKVRVNGEEYVHLRVFKPLPHTGEGPSLHSIQVGKTAADPIEHF